MAEREVSMTLLPPAPDKCQVCAADHGPEEPHNPESLYWAMARNMEGKPSPTWEDALAHCDEDVQKASAEVLAKHGVEVTLPIPEGAGA